MDLQKNAKKKAKETLMIFCGKCKAQYKGNAKDFRGKYKSKYKVHGKDF